MECALFRKDYDVTVNGTKEASTLALWNVPCLERITTTNFQELSLEAPFSYSLWNVPCLERITTLSC